MKSTVDNQIVKILISNAATILHHPFLSNPENLISFRWPSLLMYLGLETVFSNLPPFDQSQPLFAVCFSTLCANEEKEVLFHIFDRLFAENLHQINALPQINPDFLLRALKEQRQKKSFLELKHVFSSTLHNYEADLAEKTTHTMHDLILYLSWDRMCVCMARLFDYQSTDPKFIKSIGVLRECLIESYQHIAQHGRTNPGMYRMIEALLFYEMREENLQKHTTAEWTMLSQSFEILKAQDQLVDAFYIDDAVISERKLPIKEAGPEHYLTLDSPSHINSRLSLARYMLNKCKSEASGWDYVLHPTNIVFLTL